jgi:hypothetical protein
MILFKYRSYITWKDFMVGSNIELAPATARRGYSIYLTVRRIVTSRMKSSVTTSRL